MEGFVLKPLLSLHRSLDGFCYGSLQHPEPKTIYSDEIIVDGGNELVGYTYVVAFESMNTLLPSSLSKLATHLFVRLHELGPFWLQVVGHSLSC